jgi:drug/metabolite transporter (DMT)-like permease
LPSARSLLVPRRPKNSIGWLFLLAGLAWAVGFASSEYATAALYAEDSALPAGERAAWLGSWTAIVGYAIPVGLVFLLFPDGRSPSPRWRPLVFLAVLGIAATAASFSIAPGPLEDPFQEIQNPYGIAYLRR